MAAVASESSFRKLPLEKKIHFFVFALSLLTAAVGIYQYIDTKEKEFKKVFYEERIRTYTELSETVAKLATLPIDSKVRADAVQRYWELYFGKTRLVGDRELQTALSKTSTWVVFCIEKKGPPPDKYTCHETSGNSNAFFVSEAARNSIVRTLNVPLEKLDSTDLDFRGSR